MSSRSRRAFLALLASGAAGAFLWRRVFSRPAGVRRFSCLNVPKPTPEQRTWQDMELGLFIHFGMATFTGNMDATVSPDTFDPNALDTDQWMEAAVSMGARYAVLVAKHSDGFLLWQSDVYPYSLKQSAWRGGRGDVVADFVTSCAKYGVKPGLYASTCANAYWDVAYPGYVRGREPERQNAYNAATEAMLTELWSRYGELVEIWFDSTVLPPDKGGPDIAPLLARHQPRAMVMKSQCATIRISGAERGTVGYPCWATARRPDAHGSGHPDGERWLPAECDTPLRNHEWFWKPGQEDRLYSVDKLLEMYNGSVGRNANLLVNANPDQRGLIPDADMSRYVGLGRKITRRFAQPIAESSGRGETINLSLPQPAIVDHVVVQEDISHGERVREYVVEGQTHADAWRPLCEGKSIGHKRIQVTDAVRVAALRLRCRRSIARPVIRRFAAYAMCL